jgi:hypothetical protein
MKFGISYGTLCLKKKKRSWSSNSVSGLHSKLSRVLAVVGLGVALELRLTPPSAMPLYRDITRVEVGDCRVPPFWVDNRLRCHPLACHIFSIKGAFITLEKYYTRPLHNMMHTAAPVGVPHAMPALFLHAVHARRGHGRSVDMWARCFGGTRPALFAGFVLGSKALHFIASTRGSLLIGSLLRCCSAAGTPTGEEDDVLWLCCVAHN